MSSLRNCKIRGFEEVSKEYKVNDWDVVLPKRGTSKSAGYDFISPITVHLYPLYSIKIWTDVKAYMLDDEYLEITMRNSTGNKLLRLKNVKGIIDADYVDNVKTGGNICCNVYNASQSVITIRKGDRIVQGIFQKYLITDDDNPISNKRIGGEGSTGR
jgi:dUTP pyrophosphatase